MMRNERDDQIREPLGGDPLLSEALSVFDPETRRPRYWKQFHRDVMDAARFELARRRRLTDLTVAGTVTSWARTVVPTAAIAAAAAAVILLRVPAPANVVEADLGIEELLSAGLEGDAIPLELDEDGTLDVTLAAAEIF